MLPRTVQRRSCMASSSADCVFGGVRLISSASRMLAKIGPLTNVQVRRPVVGSSSMMSVPVMSRGHQVGRELDALEHQPECLRHGAHQQRLRGAGQAGDQAMPAHEQADHHLLQHLLLADDHPPHLRTISSLHLLEALDARLQFGGVKVCDRQT